LSSRKTNSKKKDRDRPDNVTDQPGLIPFPHHLGSAVIKPEDKGKIKGRAMAAMKEQTEQQMSQLYDQMKVLAEQANRIKERVNISEKIYNSEMNFEPVIGHIYHLYLKSDEVHILSMISPEEWGKEIPYQSYLVTVRLLSDHTWEVLNRNNFDSGH
jgi:hypothetical protein